jgi:uncharacterized protein DUF5989
MAPASDVNRDFERGAQARRRGLAAEFWGLLRENKKWWLLPILIVLLGIGGLILLSGTAMAPFIYTLF